MHTRIVKTKTVKKQFQLLSHKRQYKHKRYRDNIKEKEAKKITEALKYLIIYDLLTY